jgi:mannose-1-phosphate guanylyltransferase
VVWLAVLSFDGVYRMVKTQVVILAGGKGTRLRPLTYDIPKPMVPVRGKPFLEHLILFLKKQGFKNFLLLVSYLGDQIEKHFGDGKTYGVKIDYVYEKEPLGTGGALKNAQEKLKDEFILFNGDTLMPIDNEMFIREFHKTYVSAMVAAYENHDHVANNNLRLTGDNFVAEYDKKNHDNKTHVDAGVMILRKEILQYIPLDAVCSLEEEIYPKLIAQKAFKAMPTGVRFYDMGSFPGLEKIKDVLK